MIDIALLGFGTVGGGVAEILTENRGIIGKRTGEEIRIKYILDLRDFPDSPFGKLIVHDYNTILNDKDVKIVVEMMGGAHPAYDFTKAALSAGKSVVTSNKECVATFGSELLEIASANGARYLFEASVGGGIPIIRPMMNDLTSNNITSIDAILNGTTNYMLTAMADDGADYASILADAQAKGFAERNPAADVEGKDAARKIVILAAMASGCLASPDDILCEGITDITTYDIEMAKSFGYAIKLIAHYEQRDGKLLCMVSPRFVPESNPLYSVGGVFNGILVSTDMLGDVMFYGRGAGKLPTASAVVADIADIVSHGATGIRAMSFSSTAKENLADINSYACSRIFTVAGDANDISKLEKHFGKLEAYKISDGRISFITAVMSEWDAADAVRSCPLALVNKFRIL